MPAIQETPISGPTQIPVVPDYPEARNVTPEVPLAPAVETLPMADHVAAASVTNSNGIPTPPLDFPQPQTVEQIPSMIPTDLSRPPADSKTPIPVPPALDEDVMVLNPNLPIGDTYSAPRPASRDQDDTVVLPFMS